MNRFVGAAIVSALAIGAAQAQQGSGGWHGGGGMLRSADANGDGVVTRAEYQAAVDARFARMDANGDGILSPDERSGRRGMAGASDGPAPPPPGAAPPSADAGMTRDRFREQAMRRFDAMDTNHDGRIDAAEMQAMMGQYRGGRGGGGGGGSGGDAPPPAPGGAARP